MEPVFILANTNCQADQYARLKKIKRSQYIYLHSEHQLAGRRGGNIIRVGNWYMKSSARAICNLAEIRDFKIIDDCY